MKKNKLFSLLLLGLCFCSSLIILICVSFPNNKARAFNYTDSSLLFPVFEISNNTNLQEFNLETDKLSGYYFCSNSTQTLSVSSAFSLAGTDFNVANIYSITCLKEDGVLSSEIVNNGDNTFIFNFSASDYGTYVLDFVISYEGSVDTYTIPIVLHVLPGAFDTVNESYDYDSTWLFLISGDKYNAETRIYETTAFDYPYYINNKTFYIDSVLVESELYPSVIEYNKLNFQLSNLSDSITIQDSSILPDNGRYDNIEDFTSYFDDNSFTNFSINIQDIRTNYTEKKEVVLSMKYEDMSIASDSRQAKKYIETIPFKLTRIINPEDNNWNITKNVGSISLDSDLNYSVAFNTQFEYFNYDFTFSKTDVKFESLSDLSNYEFVSALAFDYPNELNSETHNLNYDSSFDKKNLTFNTKEIAQFLDSQDLISGGKYYFVCIASDATGKRVGYHSIPFEVALTIAEKNALELANNAVNTLNTSMKGVPIQNYGDHLDKYNAAEQAIANLSTTTLSYITGYEEYLVNKENFVKFLTAKRINNDIDLIKNFQTFDYCIQDELITKAITDYNALPTEFKSLVTNSSLILSLQDYVNNRNNIVLLDELANSFSESGFSTVTNALTLYNKYAALTEQEKLYVSPNTLNYVNEAISYLEGGINSLTLTCGECVNLVYNSNSIDGDSGSYVISTDDLFKASGLDCLWLISDNDIFTSEAGGSEIHIFPMATGSTNITAYYTTLEGKTYRDDVKINIYPEEVVGSLIIDNGDSDTYTTFDTLTISTSITNSIKPSNNAVYSWYLDDELQKDSANTIERRFARSGKHTIKCVINDASTGLDKLTIIKELNVELPEEMLVGKLSISKTGEGAYTTYDTLSITAELDYGTQLSDQVSYSWTIDEVNQNTNKKSISYRFNAAGAHEIVCTINDPTYDINNLKISRSVSISSVTDAEFTLSLNEPDVTYAYLKGNEIILDAYLDGFLNYDYTYSWEIFDQSVLKFFMQPSGSPEVALSPITAGECTIMVRVDTGRYESKILMHTIKIIVFDTIESIELFRENGDLTPGATVSYRASANGLDDVCNLNITWTAELNGDTPITPDKAGETLVLSSLEKGKYKVTATISGVTAEETFKIQTIPFDKILYSALPIVVIGAVIAIFVYAIYASQKPKLFVLNEKLCKLNNDLTESFKRLKANNNDKKAQSFIIRKLHGWKNTINDCLIRSKNISLQESLDMEIGEKDMVQLLFILQAGIKAYSVEFDKKKVLGFIKNVKMKNITEILDFVNQKIHTIQLQKEKSAIDDFAALDKKPQNKVKINKFRTYQEYTDYLRKINYYDAEDDDGDID